ncbi:hypothetical protein Salat_0628100 [Sesamum alatum]|uniref:Syringolide-induced protein 14-1-1 n=1 Tax=Sesamum alatum TaxID=300844 RepID=A0AAE1YS45_9LAMI|nr:hypothetical protein Salat_0628100 [Sesamum alatum]
MDHQKPAAKSKNKILKLLPRAAQAAVSFQNLPFSPRRDRRPDVNANRLRSHLNKGFSGPIVSMIPAEARGKSKNFETQEPTSPKVSCMGQIKHKKKISRKKHASLPKEFKPVSRSQPEKTTGPGSKLVKKPSGIRKFFGAGRRSDEASKDDAEPSVPAPSLSQMRRFASSRETFANFDWTTAQIAPEEDREFFSDEEGGYSDAEDDVIIPFSAPILVGGGGVAGLEFEPRKEINLWKRRTMARPEPLDLNMETAN